MGFAPVHGRRRRGGPGPLPDLAPGAAVGVSLVEGDLDLSVTGTVTHIDGDRVYAFGHPFYNLGPTRFPLKKAWVYSIFPSLQVSWKIAAALDAVGTMDQDRSTTISGRLGEGPRMIPVEVRLRSPRASERTFRFRMVEDELFTPLLGYVALLSVLQGHERATGRRDAARRRAPLPRRRPRGARARRGGLATRRRRRRPPPSPDRSPCWSATTSRRCRSRGSTSRSTRRRPSRPRRWCGRGWTTLPRCGRAPWRRCGSSSARTAARRSTQTLQVAIPPSAPTGSYTLLVADAATMDAMEQREARQGFVPRDMGQLLRALNRLRAGNRVYARLTRPGGGAVVGGEYLPALPGSVLSVLSSSDQGTGVVPLAASTVWAGELATEWAVSGWRQITVSVER